MALSNPFYPLIRCYIDDSPEKRDFSPQRRQERKDFLGDT
jgi:hypothetical protein